MSSTEVSSSNNHGGSHAWAQSWTHMSVDRRTAAYCRVTFDHPPTNTLTGTTIAELSEIVDLIEADEDLKVVVFDSANSDFYLNGPTGIRAWADLLARLSRSPVVCIASIRGRVDGAGTEFVHACDLRADDRLDGEVDRMAARVASSH